MISKGAPSSTCDAQTPNSTRWLRCRWVLRLKKTFDCSDSYSVVVYWCAAFKAPDTQFKLKDETRCLYLKVFLVFSYPNSPIGGKGKTQKVGIWRKPISLFRLWCEEFQPSSAKCQRSHQRQNIASFNTADCASNAIVFFSTDRVSSKFVL